MWNTQKQVKVDSENQNYSNHKCPKRHRKRCRFGKTCKRSESCEFIHKPKDSDYEISELKAQFEGLKNTVADMTVRIANLENELKNHQTPEKETYNVKTTEYFKCDKCGVVYKKRSNSHKTYEHKASVRYIRG